MSDFEIVETETGQMAMQFESDLVPPLKDNIYTMEHPFFSLSKRKDTEPREYDHNGAKVNIYPNVLGMPTMFDKDVLVYCISHVKNHMKLGLKPSRVTRFVARQFLKSTGRGVSGYEYDCLEKALKRLKGVTVETTIKTNNTSVKEGFGLIENYRVIERSEINDRMIALEIILSEWLFNAITGDEILTLSPAYFDITKPLKKRIYELARKHCGEQNKAELLLTTLHKKSGSTSPLKYFRHQVKEIEREDDLPDYKLVYLEEKDKVIFIPRQDEIKQLKKVRIEECKPALKLQTYENIRKMFIKRDGRCIFDVYALEEEWIMHWTNKGSQALQNPDGAFYKFCQQK